MDILFLLVPLSVLLALAVMGVLAWAVWSGQFEALEPEGQRILLADGVGLAEANANTNTNANPNANAVATTAAATNPTATPYSI